MGVVFSPFAHGGAVDLDVVGEGHRDVRVAHELFEDVGGAAVERELAAEGFAEVAEGDGVAGPVVSVVVVFEDAVDLRVGPGLPLVVQEDVRIGFGCLAAARFVGMRLFSTSQSISATTLSAPSLPNEAKLRREWASTPIALATSS